MLRAVSDWDEGGSAPAGAPAEGLFNGTAVVCARAVLGGCGPMIVRSFRRGRLVAIGAVGCRKLGLHPMEATLGFLASDFDT